MRDEDIYFDGGPLDGERRQGVKGVTGSYVTLADEAGPMYKLTASVMGIEGRTYRVARYVGPSSDEAAPPRN